MLKERVKKYLNETGVPRTVFCKKIGISTGYLYKWLHDERSISEILEVTIDTYLSKYNF